MMDEKNSIQLKKWNEGGNYSEVHMKKNRGLKRLASLACVAAMSLAGFGVGAGIGASASVDKLMDTGNNLAYAGSLSDQNSKVSGNASSGNAQLMNSFVAAQGYSVNEIFKAVSDSVVSINCTTSVQYFNQTIASPSAGSGIIFAEDEEKIYIATNNHVIEKASAVTISLDDENEATAHYVGSDYVADLAVISVTKEELASAGIINYGIATFGDSEEIEIGEPAVAIGNALGEGKSATLGIISATNKTVEVDTGRKLNLIQTDAAINPGNSGGPLVNSRGEIIGVNTAKAMSSGVEGMGYSIPSNTVITIIDELFQNGMIEKPYLGVSGQTVDEEMRDKYGFASTGFYVSSVSAGSGAAEGKLRAGDLIVRFGDVEINNYEDLTEALKNTKPGDIVTLYVFRNRVAPVELQVEIRNQNATANF